MNKKLQVFISSTYIDLIDERQAAVQAVLDSGHIPAGMELFKAGNRTQLETIYKWIDASDVYMLILGGRYGCLEDASGKSYTHLEYEYAISRAKPVFAVVLSASFLNLKAEKLDNDRVYEMNNVQKYDEFKATVMSRIIRTANDSKDIMLAIHTTLKEFLEEYDLGGWVRSNDSDANASLLKQIHDLNTDNKNLRDELSALKIELANIQISFDASIAFEGEEITIIGTYEESRGRGSTYTSITRTIQKSITWDRMFLLWASRLLSTLNTRKAQVELESGLRDYMERYFHINENQYNIIKLQYHALGLIDIFEAKTTTGGTAEFVKLSPKGKQYLIQNSAVKKAE